MLGVNSTRTDLLVASVSSLKKTSVTKVPCRSTRREHTDGVADYSTGFGASALVRSDLVAPLLFLSCRRARCRWAAVGLVYFFRADDNRCEAITVAKSVRMYEKSYEK